MIQSFLLKLLITIAIIFTIALTIMLAMSFGMWLTIP